MHVPPGILRTDVEKLLTVLGDLGVTVPAAVDLAELLKKTAPPRKEYALEMNPGCAKPTSVEAG